MTIQEIKKLNPRRYYIDFDSTLVNSVKAIVCILNNQYNKHVDYKDINEWDFSDHFKIDSKGVLTLFDSEEFFNIVEFYDGALEFLKENINKVTIISKGNPTNLKLKGEFLAKNGLSEIKYIGLPLNKSKGCISMTDCVFIDDVTSNLYETNATYKIQFREFDEDKSWNSGWDREILISWK